MFPAHGENRRLRMMGAMVAGGALLVATQIVFVIIAVVAYRRSQRDD